MNNSDLNGGSKKQTLCRKSNGRSKTGCLSCRHRRIKCDETRPRCSKCTKHSLLCDYPSADPSKQWQKSIVTFTMSTPLRHVHDTSDTKAEGVSLSICETWNSAPMMYAAPTMNSDAFGIRDVQLLAHFTAVTSYEILGGHEIWQNDVLKLAFQNDFLMHAILMTAASHLQQLDNNSSNKYDLQAAYHLQKSMRSFRVALDTSVSSLSNNVDAIIGTAILLIIHGYSHPTFKFDSSWEVDPLLTHSSGLFEIVKKTREHALSGIFQVTCSPRLLPLLFPTTGPGLDLIFLVQTNFPVSVEDNITLTAVIKSLTIILETTTSRPNLGNTPPGSLLVYLVRWLSFLPLSFVALVNKRDPKALIIMAHYYSTVAFLLNELERGWWWMRARPAYMVSQISAFLGDQWKPWMRWPLDMLERCNSGTLRMKNAVNQIDLTSVEANGTSGSELGILSDLPLHLGKIQVE